MSTTPTPPPGYTTAINRTKPLARGAKYWSAIDLCWNDSDMTGGTWFNEGKHYAIPITPTVPAGETTNEKGGEPCLDQSQVTCPSVSSNAPADVQSGSQGQELDLGRLIKSLPADVNKKLSLHDLKRIADNYNAK